MKSIGIDPGDHAAKVVVLDGSYKKTRLLHADIAPVKGSDAAARAQAVVTALGEGQRGEIQLAHPCREAVLRPLELPFKGRDAIRKVVKSEIESEIQSQSVDDMVVDFHEIGPGTGGSTKLLVAAVPKPGLRTMVKALTAEKLEPEHIDLDNMALWRVADWAGVFDEERPSERNVTAVIDIGAHSTNVILVEGDHLVEMRVIRIGDGVVADDIARKHGLDPVAARQAVADCLRTGNDQRIDVAVQLPAAGATAPAAAADDDDDATDGDGEANVPAVQPQSRAVQIRASEIEALHTACLQRIARELTRFLAGSGHGDRIGAVWATGGASVSPGAMEMLTAVFGTEVRHLDLLAKLQHDLDPAEATELAPRLAIALGMALGPFGGPDGFELRQEDLQITRGFERVKFPLAVACLMALLATFVHWQNRKAQLQLLEKELGTEYIEAGKSPQFFGMLYTVFYTKWFDSPANFRFTKNGKDYTVKNLTDELLAVEPHRRLNVVRDRLREAAEEKQKQSGIYEDISLESGLAVLVRWSELMRSVEKDLGRFLITRLRLNMKSPNRELEFKIALRGDDFRDRHAVLLRAVEAELARADTPFTKPDRADAGKVEETFRDSAEKGVSGAYMTVTLHIKDTFRPFGGGGANAGNSVGAIDNPTRAKSDALANAGGGK